MIRNSFIIFAGMTFVHQAAMAVSEHHGEAGIPGDVKFQAINLAIFIGILIWFAKDKVRSLFQSRYDDFMRLARETEKARADLEAKKSDLIRRAEQLHRTTQQSLEEAKKEADRMVVHEIDRAKGQAQKIAKDVDSQVRAEQAKLVEKLRLEALEMSLVSAEAQLLNTENSEKTRLSKQFASRVEGATV